MPNTKAKHYQCRPSQRATSLGGTQRTAAQPTSTIFADLASNGSSSFNGTKPTESSILCKKILNKVVTLRTQPHRQLKRLSDLQDRHISGRHKFQQAELESVSQTINYTNRQVRNHQYLATQAFNNTGKYSSHTDCKCRYFEDLVALQSKTTVRKLRKQSSPNIVTQISGYCRSPSKDKTKTKNMHLKLQSGNKSIKKPKPVVVIKNPNSQRKIKVKAKPVVQLQIQKIQRDVINAALRMSDLSYGQHSKSEPDLFYRTVESKQTWPYQQDQERAARAIQSFWRESKKKEVLSYYSRMFNKRTVETPVSRKSIVIPWLQNLECIQGQKTISDHLNQDHQNDFNVYKYVEMEPQPDQQRSITKVKKKNRRLQKELLKFKSKQITLCESFQNALLSTQENIKPEELLQLLIKYKTEFAFPQTVSQLSSSISYKSLLEEKGIAAKLASSMSPALRIILDDQDHFRKNKTHSKSELDTISLRPTTSPKMAFRATSLTPPVNQLIISQEVETEIETKRLLSTYLDCQLITIPYRKEHSEREVQAAIQAEMQQFNNEDEHTQKFKQILEEPSKAQELCSLIQTSIIEEIGEQFSRIPSMVRNLECVRRVLTFNKSLEIGVGLAETIEYLRGFIQHVLKNKKAVQMVLENINKLLGSSSVELLYYLRTNVDQSYSEYNGDNPYTFVVPMGLFQEYESLQRSTGLVKSQQAVMIQYFWRRSIFELLNQTLDKKRPYGIQGKPYAWNCDVVAGVKPITTDGLSKILESSLSQAFQILRFPTGLMFDSPTCQYFQCDISDEDKMKINQDRLCLIMCEQVIDEEATYHNYQDQVAEVLILLSDYVQEIILFDTVVDLRRLDRRRLLLSI